MTAFSAGVNTLFSDPNLSVAATYCPQGGAEISLRVIRPARGNTDFNPFGPGASVPADRAEVRVADVAVAAKGDILLIDSERFQVRKAERDDERLTWLLDLDKKG